MGRYLDYPCSISSCDHPAWSRGWCITHYSKWRSHGDPLHPSRTDPLEVRIWRKIDKDIGNGCWHWTGQILPNGYAMGGMGDHMMVAHKVVYKLLVGDIPPGKQLDHTCHNIDLNCEGGFSCLHRRCVNPEHLEPVTCIENNRRRIQRTNA